VGISAANYTSMIAGGDVCAWQASEIPRQFGGVMSRMQYLAGANKFRDLIKIETTKLCKDHQEHHEGEKQNDAKS
jgi:hypothetical protein